jgi:hypothetical protein
MNNLLNLIGMKCTAANERFGASGAVARPKVCADLQVLRPCERQWKPRLRQAAWTLGDTREVRHRNLKRNLTEGIMLKNNPVMNKIPQTLEYL